MDSALRVLYVDDEPDIREIAVMALELDRGLEVKSAASGQEALDFLKQWMPDVILLDVMMPDMDGPETLRRIRSDPAFATIPVVFITARTQKYEIEHFISLSAAGVIAKPFDPMTLAQQARSFCSAPGLHSAA